MELTFVRDGNKWVTEFEVNSDFNLHIEKGAGSLSVLQTSVAGGKYDNVPSLRMSPEDATMDKDVTALLYPKTLRIEAYTKEAPYAVVSSEGDVADITNVLTNPV
jgi:hypothetical protein